MALPVGLVLGFGHLIFFGVGFGLFPRNDSGLKEFLIANHFGMGMIHDGPGFLYRRQSLSAFLPPGAVNDLAKLGLFLHDRRSCRCDLRLVIAVHQLRQDLAAFHAIALFNQDTFQFSAQFRAQVDVLGARLYPARSGNYPWLRRRGWLSLGLGRFGASSPYDASGNSDYE